MVDPFEVLLGPHLDKLYRLAYRLTSSAPDAEDLVQDVLTKLYLRRNELSSIRDLSPWLSRVLYNQFIDARRRDARRPLQLVDNRFIDQTFAGDGDPALDAAAREDAIALQAALAKLSEDHRIVLLLHDAEGYKLSQIHEVTGISLGTLKSRLSRGRARLREVLIQEGTFFESAACSDVDGVQIDAL